MSRPTLSPEGFNRELEALDRRYVAAIEDLAQSRDVLAAELDEARRKALRPRTPDEAIAECIESLAALGDALDAFGRDGE